MARPLLFRPYSLRTSNILQDFPRPSYVLPEFPRRLFQFFLLESPPAVALFSQSHLVPHLFFQNPFVSHLFSVSSSLVFGMFFQSPSFLYMFFQSLLVPHSFSQSSLLPRQVPRHSSVQSETPPSSLCSPGVPSSLTCSPRVPSSPPIPSSLPRSHRVPASPASSLVLYSFSQSPLLPRRFPRPSPVLSETAPSSPCSPGVPSFTVLQNPLLHRPVRTELCLMFRTGFEGKGNMRTWWEYCICTYYTKSTKVFVPS